MDDLENKHSPYNDAKWNADANTKKRKKVALAILRGLASREQRDANPRGMTQRKQKKEKRFGHSAWVGVPSTTGRQPTQNDTTPETGKTIDFNKKMIDFNEN